jgi:hypothetical protein
MLSKKGWAIAVLVGIALVWLRAGTQQKGQVEQLQQDQWSLETQVQGMAQEQEAQIAQLSVEQENQLQEMRDELQRIEWDAIMKSYLPTPEPYTGIPSVRQLQQTKAKKVKQLADYQMEYEAIMKAYTQ